MFTELPPALARELNSAYPLTQEAMVALKEDGFVHLKRVFSPELLAYFREPLAHIVKEESRALPPLAERDAYGQAFAQIMNIWTRHESVRDFILNRRTAEIAARLMGVEGVRMWHDQALYKEAGGGVTPWHCDQYYWPISNDNAITAWIPLQDTPVSYGALQFAAGSHKRDYGRERSIQSQSDVAITQALATDGLPVVAKDFALGDVSFHLGWTFHHAAANPGTLDRAAMTMIYIDHEMRVAEPRNANQVFDQKTWAPGCAVGEPIASEINPVLFSSD